VTAASSSSERTILLASGSPRRREILEALGHRVVVRPVDVDERERESEGAEAYLRRIVDAKLEAARALLDGSDAVAVVVADTMVSCDGAILHKPVDAADNARMLRALAARSHLVTTRFAIAGRGRGDPHVESVATKVVFRALEEGEIEAYAGCGEGLDKAGGYALQGRGGSFIVRIEGSYGAVIGLPHSEITLALRALVR
jgi:septum formation protein